MQRHTNVPLQVKYRIDSCGKPGHKGRGVLIYIISKHTTNSNLILTISQLLTDKIMKVIEDSIPWALV